MSYGTTPPGGDASPEELAERHLSEAARMYNSAEWAQRTAQLGIGYALLALLDERRAETADTVAALDRLTEAVNALATPITDIAAAVESLTSAVDERPPARRWRRRGEAAPARLGRGWLRG